MILCLSLCQISNWRLNFDLLIFNIVDLCLNIIERPLLAFLHLNHHFLNLFELLETIGLHFFKLFLFRYEHIKSCLIISKEGMLNHFIALIFLKLNASLDTFFPSLIKCIWTQFLRLLNWLLHLLILNLRINWFSKCLNALLGWYLISA